MVHAGALSSFADLRHFVYTSDAMSASTAEKDRPPLARRIAAALAIVQALVAVGGWCYALARGQGQPDVVSAAFAVLLTAIAGSLLLTWPIASRRGATAVLVWSAVALLALPVEIWLARRSGKPRYRFESAISSGRLDAPDERFHWSITIAEPFDRRQHAFLLLERSGREELLPLPLRRSAADNIAAGSVGQSMRALGGERYWLSIGTGWVRRGPQYFLVDLSRQPTRLEEISRGLEVENGHPGWDCEVWGGGEGSLPTLEAFCAEDGTLPPRRACELRALAVRCTEAAVVAAGCRPELTADDSTVIACLERRGREGDPLAWDALILAAAESYDGRRIADVAARARAVDESREPRCAAAREGGRLLAAGRRLGRWWRWLRLQGAGHLLSAPEDPACDALPSIAAELAIPRELIAWEAAVIERDEGRLERSCARVYELESSGGIDCLPTGDREEARRWRAACLTRDRVRLPR